MISLENVHLHSSIDSLDINGHDTIFFGENIDERTHSIIDKITKLNHSSAVKIRYDTDSFRVIMNSVEYHPLHLKNYFLDNKFNSIFIDSTSLDFPELIYLLFAIKSSNVSCRITVSYIEPNDYKQSLGKEKNGINEQEFILSDKKGNFTYIPLFSINSSQTKKATLVTTLGFESSRLGQLLEQDDGFAYERIEAFVGLPAYKPGWENRSIHKHIRYLSPEKAELKLYPASNPYEFSKQLKKLATCKGARHVVFAPMGTKPALLAICIFLINNKISDTSEHIFGALYDFPKKSRDRSKGIGKIYSYSLSSS